MIENKTIRLADGENYNGVYWGTADNDPACDGCAFYQLLNGSSLQKCCHYLLYTGSVRPCEPGKGCTVKKEGKDALGG